MTLVNLINVDVLWLRLDWKSSWNAPLSAAHSLPPPATQHCYRPIPMQHLRPSFSTDPPLPFPQHFSLISFLDPHYQHSTKEQLSMQS